MVAMIRHKLEGAFGASLPARRRLATADGNTARRERGFTMLEVLVSMGILATGLLAVSAAQLYAMRGGHTSRHTTDAAEFAQQKIEELDRRAWTDLVSTAGAWTPNGGEAHNTSVTTVGAPLTEQAYKVDWRITDTIGPTGTVFLKTIDVRVQWDEPNRPGRIYTISTMRHNDAKS
jgi:prepilin-type N-terminal cleavage/methylation domain-containing protein